MPLAWTDEQEHRLVMALLMASTSDFKKINWTGAMPKINEAFGGLTKNACSLHFAKLRKAFMATPIKEEDNEGKDAGPAAPKRKAGGKKRPAHATKAEDSEDDDADADDDTTEPRPKRAKRVAANGKKFQDFKVEDDVI
ncbi:hypothetical protein PG994_012885 [Apiospora phragmitis]|uniref:Myb-like domain-containing protein n=1 Tax=Apiospora phragmitis TaxID=2905665 RepID=A0ABR1T731_9PEZI